MAREALTHNPSNPITVGIWRVRDDEGHSWVRKELAQGRTSDHPDWSSSNDPRHWMYWRREACVYEDGLADVYALDGIRGPEVLGVHPDDDGRVVLRLEDVQGRSDERLGPDDLVEVAARLGRAQGRLALQPVARPWLSLRFLGDHIASKHVDAAWLDDDRAWAHPLVADCWPEGLRAGLHRLHGAADRLLRLAAATPRTLAHLDLWSHNLIVRGDEVVLIDWACCGDGALGEDVSNMVVEAVLDRFVDPDALPSLGARALDAYVDGVVASGWSGDPRWVRLGFCAAAVKWVWLGPLHLQRAVQGGHHVYGGQDTEHPDDQYRARGRALAQVVAWADEAQRVGDALGL